MSSSPRTLRTTFGLVATLGLVLGGAAVAAAETPDAGGRTGDSAAEVVLTADVPAAAGDAQLSEIVAPAWVYAYEWTTVSVVVSGSIPTGSYIDFDVYDGPGGGTCDPADAVGIAKAAAVLGTVSDPDGWAPKNVGQLGWNAVLRDSDDTVLDATACGVIEVRAFFTDVPGAHPFFGQIQQLGVLGVAEGYQPGPQFKPAQPQSRQGLAAFLQRFLMAGDPAPACTAAPFTDVPVGHPFCAEIAWLKAQGFIGGYDDGTYRPGAPVTRQAGATIIARALGMDPGATCEADLFTDLPAGHPFCGAIAWLADEVGVQGYVDGTFRPGAPMTRQAMAAWLESSFLE